MGDDHDCPLCGARMTLAAREVTEHIPGRPQSVRRTLREWVCPACDHFEEEDSRQEPDR